MKSKVNNEPEGIMVRPKVKVSLKIQPFGTISYEATGMEEKVEEKESEMPRYIVPLTTL
ncbi:MAG: hypothetical protein ABC596_05795 [Candidatus Methanosuratincola petrocarbonis]